MGDVVWENLVVFGGWDSSNRICCDVQMLLLQRAGCRWERLAVHGLLPRAVYGSTLTRIECEDYGECALVFGGVLHGGYRGATAQWAVLRQQHAVAATTAPSLYTPPPTFLYPNTPTTVAWGDGGQVSVGAHQSFSGAGGGGAVRDYKNASECEYEWVYPQSEDGANQRQQPTARAYHTATFDARLGVVFVFGGFANGRPLSRLQVLQVGRGQGALLDTWTWWSPTISGLDPPPRYGHSASLVGRDLIIAGGCSGGHNHKGMASGGADLFDIFILKVGESLSDELAWTQVALPDAAPFRGLQRCHSSFVAGHKVIFAFGGPSHAMTNQVRSFDVCTQTFDPAPTLLGNPPRARQGAVLAKVDARTAVVFGGWSWQEMGDVHFLRLVADNAPDGLEQGPEFARTMQRRPMYSSWLGSFNSASFCFFYKDMIVKSLLGAFTILMVATLVCWSVRVYSW